ncbi:hypothetical protein [Dinoroseobacter sp. S124A]|uniref:hypothetical protein n=1 Tax=Dinoroseobacter sp. S124A TaxID=3415128 RepID=UPI003C7D2744
MSEPVCLIKIELPRCTRTHGSAPCTATETGDAKCYNTFSSCNDQENFDKGTFDVWFSRGNLADSTITDAPSYILPFVASVSSTGGTINFAGSKDTEIGLGYVSTLTVQFKDGPHSDQLMDPYRDDRTVDPRTKSTFWRKFKARNVYLTKAKVTRYEGYKDDALADMRATTYYATDLTVTRQGATLTAKDPFTFLDFKSSDVPAKSTGILYQDITDEQLDLPIIGAGVEDYPAPGMVRIGDELISYESVHEESYGIRIRATERGHRDTEQDDHSNDTEVQICFVLENRSVDEAFGDILAETDFPDAVYDATQAASVAGTWRRPWTGALSRVVSEPTPARELLGQLVRHTLTHIDYDELTGKTKLLPVRGYDSNSLVLDDDKDIVAGSFKVSDMPLQRISRAILHYNLVSPVADPDEELSYRTVVEVNGRGGDDNRDGVDISRKLYSPWLTSDILAFSTCSRLHTLCEITPIKCSFQLHPSRSSVKRGDIVRKADDTVVTGGGDPITKAWFITKAHQPSPGGLIDCEAWDVSPLGRVGYFQAADTPAYVGDGSDDPDGFFIGDSKGLLPDGSEAPRLQ